jgi:hypothetical protein
VIVLWQHLWVAIAMAPFLTRWSCPAPSSGSCWYNRFLGAGVTTVRRAFRSRTSPRCSTVPRPGLGVARPGDSARCGAATVAGGVVILLSTLWLPGANRADLTRFP